MSVRLLVGVRLVVDTPSGEKIHTQAIDVREYGPGYLLEAALDASHAAFKLAYQALGKEIKPGGDDEPVHIGRI